MTGYDLPVSLRVGGKDYAIRYGWRAIIDVLIAMNDPELDSQSKAIVMLKIVYPAWNEIPYEDLREACEKACSFIDCGQKDDGKNHPRIIDWEQDASIIIPAVNNVSHTEIRLNPDLHWWTFFGYFMEIRESLFSSIINIRQKLSKGKRLEDYEKEFYRENKDLIEFKKNENDQEDQNFWENLLKD